MTTNDLIRFYSLWPARSGNGYNGSYERDVDTRDIAAKIAEGWNILLFQNDQKGNDRAPSHRLVLAPPRDQPPQQSRTVDERRDAPSRGVGRGDSGRAMDAQAPGGGRRSMAAELSDDVPFRACWEA